VKDKENVIAKVLEAKRSSLVRNPSVRLSDLLAAREDLAIIEKTSSASVRKHTQTKLNKLIIGQVMFREVLCCLSCELFVPDDWIVL